MLEVHGRRFKRAYERSRCGESLVVTYTTPNGAGWFPMGWRLDGERVMSRTVTLGDLTHNPVVGYLLVDATYSVIAPPGEAVDLAFYTPADARQAAQVWGRAAEVHEVVELHLEGILSVVLGDEGDILVDGRTAERFVAACERKGLRVAEEARARVDAAERAQRYSCRELLGA